MSRSPAKAHTRLAPGARCRAAVPLGVSLAFLVTTPAAAASLSGPVAGYTTASVPSYVTMYEYVPANPAATPPIVVAAHYCGGNANGMFGSVSGIVSAADQYGFVMIFPQTPNNCWDVGSTQSLTHDGGGDTQAIAEMVKYAIGKHAADANRVYVMGISSGAMMTEALLAVYPDVFKAGAEFSGVPAGCWAVNYSPSNQWSSPCASGMVSNTAQRWGDLVRAMYPGYSGFRPRVQLWHGTADTTINYNDMTEAIKEWTNVLGLSATPTSMDAPMSGYSRESWQNSCGFTVLQAWTQQNGGHTTPVDSAAVIGFFGLDKTGPDPEVAACADAGPSGSSSSGGSGESDGGGAADASPTSSSSGGSSSTSGSGSMGGSSGGNAAGSGTASSGGPNGGASSGASGPSTGGGPSHSIGGDASVGSAPTGGGAGESASNFGLAPPTQSGCACTVPLGTGRGDEDALVAAILLAAVLRGRRRSGFGASRAL